MATKVIVKLPDEADYAVRIGSGIIEALGRSGRSVDAALSSSEKTTAMLRDIGIRVLDPNEVEGCDVYIDGADEVNPAFDMIKGGGACLTREKIVSSIAAKFVCIVDHSKLVKVLGTFPLPVEVIPMAARAVSASLAKLGGRPVKREGCITDNGCVIIDVHGLKITTPAKLEDEINGIPGVVTVGLFAHRGADVVLYADAGGEIVTKVR